MNREAAKERIWTPGSQEFLGNREQGLIRKSGRQEKEAVGSQGEGTGSGVRAQLMVASTREGRR
jgi:hypothetical protein